MDGRELERRKAERRALSYRGLEAVSLRFYGRMAGLLFVISSVGALPSAYLLAEQNELPVAAYVMPVLGVITGVVVLLIHWERRGTAWLHAMWVTGIVQIFVITDVTGDHLAVLYLLVMAWAAYVYRRPTTVLLVGAACVVALLIGILLGPGDSRHAAGVSFILTTTLVALGVTVFFARSRAQEARAEAAETTAEIVRVALRLERGHERVGNSRSDRDQQLHSLLEGLDAFKLALRESPIRIDSAPITVHRPRLEKTHT